MSYKTLRRTTNTGKERPRAVLVVAQKMGEYYGTVLDRRFVVLLRHCSRENR
jgi:hypothetical protein